MDIKESNDFRYARYYEYNSDNIKYNYVKEGILCKCLPKILFKGNGVLVTFIQLIDMRLILLLKNIDNLKTFKYITNY